MITERMGDLSFTATHMAMTSRPLPRVNHEYKPWWQMVAKHNAKPKVLIDRQRDGKRSNPNVFMGC